MNLLSIQSWVSYGHVGNAAALPCLHALGHEAWALNTVAFSNHPGHGGFTGRVTPAEEVRALLDGIEARGVLGSCAAVMSGYLGEVGTGPVVLDAVARVRRANPAALFCCDPVMGEAGHIFVRPGIPAFFRELALAEADLVTPNVWELGWLTDTSPLTMAEALRSAEALRTRLRPGGPRLVVATGLAFPPRDDRLATLLLAETGAVVVRTPRLHPNFSGTGDSLAALLLGRLLRGEAPAEALAQAVSGLHAVLAEAVRRGERELPLVAARDVLLAPEMVYAAETIGP